MKGKLGYKIRTITCIVCGKTVTDHMRQEQKYCTLECYRNSERPQRKTGETRNCAFCEKPIYIRKNQLHREYFFCSKDHADLWSGRNKTEHICKMCGKLFKWSPSRSKNNNITYCSLACRDSDPIRRDMLIAMNAIQQGLQPNNTERIGYKMIEGLDVMYYPQHVIADKFCVDAFLPLQKIVIQFDGDYWHGNHKLFPNPDTRQRKRMSLDVSQDAYMLKCGFTVVRIWASALNTNLDFVTSKLQQIVIHPPHVPSVLRLSLDAL